VTVTGFHGFCEFHFLGRPIDMPYLVLLGLLLLITLLSCKPTYALPSIAQKRTLFIVCYSVYNSLVYRK